MFLPSSSLQFLFYFHFHFQEATNLRLTEVPDGRVLAIQFVARNVILGTTWVNNRWLLTLNSPEALRELLNHGLEIEGEEVKVRRYDDVLKAEYHGFMIAKIKRDSEAKHKIGVRR